VELEIGKVPQHLHVGKDPNSLTTTKETNQKEIEELDDESMTPFGFGSKLDHSIGSMSDPEPLENGVPANPVQPLPNIITQFLSMFCSTIYANAGFCSTIHDDSSDASASNVTNPKCDSVAGSASPICGILSPVPYRIE
jgi:hypothetical protein